jgi:predicted CoA-binding protein
VPHANPRETEVFGRRAYASLAEIPQRAGVDIVDVFRIGQTVQRLGISSRADEAA